MKRRHFIESIGLGGTVLAGIPLLSGEATAGSRPAFGAGASRELKADVVIAGGGLGGCAAALGALRNGLRVILTEETDWLGGQISQQGVPPDEHWAIETHGATQLYREFRSDIRAYYKKNYPLTDEARKRPHLNPGDGSVSPICHEPRVTVAVLLDKLAPYLSNGRLTLLPEHKIAAADTDGDSVRALRAVNLRNRNSVILNGAYFVDATETGELLPLTRTEYVTGAEARSETNEMHAAEKADPKNNQAFTVCFAMDYVKGENHVIDKPRDYNFWKNFVPKMKTPWSGHLLALSYSNPRTLKPKDLGFHPEGIKTGENLNLWNYRKIINRFNFTEGTYPGDITIVNWPQNDYFLGNVLDVSEKEFNTHFDKGKQLSLSLLYWLQTEAPRPDGGQGWSGLRLRPDVMGTEDGMAKYPYIRESRRIKALFTILEEHVGKENRLQVAGPKEGVRAAAFPDSVGVGYYHIDLHPSTGGDNYIDFGSLPFQIPLGALIPRRMKNLLPANKNIGTTHLTNGCYRLHPVEWSIGEVVGVLTAYALKHNISPKGIREQRLEDFQNTIRQQGIETHWPEA